jgi:predicted DNA-binding protein (UPF0251 family)
MPRPKLNRNISFNPKVRYFKPQGVPMRNIEIVELLNEEIEAYRLRYIHNLDQKSAAKKMDISTSTYQRIIDLAYKKIADALINGKAIKIVK